MASALFASLAAGVGLRGRAHDAMPDVQDDADATPALLEETKTLDAPLPYGHGGSGGAEDDDDDEEEEEEKPKKKGKKKKGGGDDDDEEKPKKGKSKKKKGEEEEGACAPQRSRVAAPAARSDIQRRAPPSTHHLAAEEKPKKGKKKKGGDEEEEEEDEKPKKGKGKKAEKEEPKEGAVKVEGWIGGFADTDAATAFVAVKAEAAPLADVDGAWRGVNFTLEPARPRVLPKTADAWAKAAAAGAAAAGKAAAAKKKQEEAEAAKKKKKEEAEAAKKAKAKGGKDKKAKKKKKGDDSDEDEDEEDEEDEKDADDSGDADAKECKEADEKPEPPPKKKGGLFACCLGGAPGPESDADVVRVSLELDFELKDWKKVEPKFKTGLATALECPAAVIDEVKVDLAESAYEEAERAMAEKAEEDEKPKKKGGKDKGAKAKKGKKGDDDDDEEEEEEEEKPKKKGKGKKAKKKDDDDADEEEEDEKPKKGKGKKAKKKDDDGDEEEEEKPKKGKDKKPKKKKEEPKPIRILGRVGGFKSADEAKTLAASMSLAGDERPEALREKWGAEYVLSAKADTPVVEPKVKKDFEAAREAQDKVRPAEVDVVAFAITLAEITNEATWAKRKLAFTKEFAAALEVDAKQLDELKVDVVDAVPKPKKEKKGKKAKKGGDETPKKGKKAKKDGDGPDEAQLRAKFDEYDTDGSGAIEKEELRALLKATSGVDPSDEEVDEMMAKADDDGDGTMSFEEFVTTYRKVQSGELEFAAFSTMMKDFDSLVNALDDEAKPEDVEVAEAEEEDTTA